LGFPTTRIPPPKIGEETEVDIGGQKVPMNAAVGRNIAVGSCASMASLALPAGLTASGLPIAAFAVEVEPARGAILHGEPVFDFRAATGFWLGQPTSGHVGLDVSAVPSGASSQCPDLKLHQLS
jgi:hypothetical protein